MGKKLVLVVGAGASCELGLPTGEQLRGQIAKAVNVGFQDGHRMSSGEPKIYEAFGIVADGDHNRRREYVLAGRRIAAAMPQARSIDNFIDNARDFHIEAAGKIAIAHCILEAERNSSLYVSQSNIYNSIDFDTVGRTWLNAFFQTLIANCPPEQLPHRMQQIAIINFNYDRCIEHFLWWSLRNYFNLEDGRAAELVNMVEIHHPYGTVGRLPWQAPGQAVPFGESVGAQQLVSVAAKIKTFTESTSTDSPEIVAIRDAIWDGERVLFLGFAYHAMNLELLQSPRQDDRNPKKAVYGTAYKISQSDVEIIRTDLRRMCNVPSVAIKLERDLQCSTIFQEYSRSLSLD